MNMPPHSFPPQFCDTRSQAELFPSFLPSRSQRHWTLIRPYLSVWIVSPDGPTTTAVCTPDIFGIGVIRSGRNCTESGMQVKRFSYTIDSLSSVSSVGWLAECSTDVSKYDLACS